MDGKEGMLNLDGDTRERHTLSMSKIFLFLGGKLDNSVCYVYQRCKKAKVYLVCTGDKYGKVGWPDDVVLRLLVHVTPYIIHCHFLASTLFYSAMQECTLNAKAFFV
jgi:hypothetical protein